MVFTLDTNIMGCLLKGDKNVLHNIQNAIKSDKKLIINPVTFYEIYRGLLNKNVTEQLEKFKQFCNQFETCMFTKKTFVIAAEIYADLAGKGRLMDDADILIAALCIENGYVLITNNEKQFKKIDNLIILNWT